MRVTVLLFAAFREAIGRNRLEIDLPEGATAEQVYSVLGRQQPAFDQMRPYTTFAVNRDVVSPNHRLKDGDEVAFLQPSSGG